MPLSPSVSTSSFNSIRSGASSKKRVTSLSSTEHEVYISDAARIPIAEPMSRTESPAGDFERMLDEQEKRMSSAIGDPKNLSKKNNKTLAKHDKTDEVFFPSDSDVASYRAKVEALLNRFGIRLINNFDTKTTLQAVIDANIISAKQVNDPKNFKGKSTATNEIDASHLNKIKEYLSGRGKAAATVLRSDNLNRLTPEEFIEKINQASIEARFFQLESLLTEKDPNKKPNAEVREKVVYEISLLAAAVKIYSNEFSLWYNENKENKEKFQEVLQINDDSSSAVKNKANDAKNAINDRIFVLQKEVGRLQKELSQAQDAFKKEQQKVQKLENQSKDQRQQRIADAAKDQQAIDGLQEKVKALQEEISRIKKELIVANTTIQQKEETIKGLDAEIGILSSNLQDQEQKYLEERNSKDKTKDDYNASFLVSAEKEKKLIGQISQLNDEISALKTDQKRIQNELTDVRSELAIANTGSDLKQAAINELNHKLKISENSIDEKESCLKKLTTDLVALQNKNAEDNVKILRLQEEKIKLKKSLEAEKTAHHQATAKISMMETQLQTIKSELEAKNSSIAELEEKLHLLEIQTKKEQDYQAEKTKLNAEISELKLKLKASESNHIHINELEQELKLLKEKTDRFKIKEQEFDDIKKRLHVEISELRSNLNSSAANVSIIQRLDLELDLLKVKLSESEAREIVYKEQQTTLNTRILELEEAYDYLKLTASFADAFTLPSNAIKAVAALHKFIKKYSEHGASNLLGKVFSEIGRLLKDFPNAGPEFAKTSIQMLYDLVENNEMSSLDALHLLLFISPAMSDFIDRAPISKYLFALIFLVKCEGTSEAQQRKQKLIIEKLDERKKDSDLYKVLKQMLKQGYGKSLETPAELREALIRFKSAELVPEDRELFKFIKPLEKNFQLDAASSGFSEKFCVTSDYLAKVENLENLDNPKETQIQKVGTWSRMGRTLIGKGGSVRVKACATAGFWQKAPEISDQQSMQTFTGSLRRKAYSNRRPALTESTFTQPTDQELGSANSNGVRTLNK